MVLRNARTKKDMLKYLRMWSPRDAFAAMILSKGVWFLGRASADDYESTKQWKKTKKPRAQQCFYNSQRFCAHFNGTRYFEGYVLIAGLPMMHAWVVMDDETVVDFTFEAAQRKTRREEGFVETLDPLYFGVEIPRQFLMAQSASNRDPIAQQYYGRFQDTMPGDDSGPIPESW
jgi:hypothetical protein